MLSGSDSTQSNDSRAYDPDSALNRKRSEKEVSLLYRHSPDNSSASSTEYLMSASHKSKRRQELKPVVRKQSRSKSKGLMSHYESVLAPNRAMMFSPAEETPSQLLPREP